jgi:hypothetical protein
MFKNFRDFKVKRYWGEPSSEKPLMSYKNKIIHYLPIAVTIFLVILIVGTGIAMTLFWLSGWRP